MPKLAVNAKGCEIDRIMRLTPSSIDPVAVEVPRKDKNRTFQDDLFPDTFARTAAIGSGEYFKGSDAFPLTVSVQKAGSAASTSTLRNRPGSLELKQQKSVEASNTTSSPMSAKANRANSLFAGQSKFKYVRMTTQNKEHTHFDLNIDTSVVTPC